MQLIRAQKSPAAVEAALGREDWNPWLRLPCVPHMLAYYRAVAGEGLEDRSFLLEQDGTVLAVVACNAAAASLSNFGFPIEPLTRPGLAYAARREIAVQVIAELRRLSLERPGFAVRVRSAPNHDADGLLLGMLAEEAARMDVELRVAVDLRAGEGALLADLRAAYRRHLKWAASNMRIACVDARSFDRGAFEAFRALHAEAAGRVTRPAASWERMARSIEAGLADLVLGYWQGALVAATYVVDCNDTTYYATGAYRRELFDKPISHGTMFEAIRRAAGRGQKVFDVGDIPGPDSGATDKEKAIGHFKRGFSSMTRSSVVLTWTPGA